MDTRTYLDLFLCIIVLLFVLLPRFNKWPEAEMGRFQGQPRDYIHDRVYWFYASVYLLTFVVFTFALSRLQNINALLSGLGFSDQVQSFLTLIQQLFGEQSFIFFFVIVLGLLAIPQVTGIDQRWRGVLLTLARVPKDALSLKQQLLDSVGYGDIDPQRMNQVIEKLSLQGFGDFWYRILQADDKTPLNVATAHALLKAFNLLCLNKQFEYVSPGAEDLRKMELRLNEIAAVLPAQDPDANVVSLQEYRKEIDKHLDDLVEILAKNCVKKYPEIDRRYSALSQYGFELEYIDQKEFKITIPAFISISAILASCVLTIMLSMMLFDAFGVSPPRDGDWFTGDRIFHWSLGGWVSYTIAACFGLFFNEVLKKHLGQRSVGTYILAFVFATLGSCIFFVLAREDFKPPFVWLAFSFGLLSVVAIKSRNREYTQRAQVMNKATQLSLQYGLVSGVLQVIVHIAFRGMENSNATNMVAFFVFGFIRGGSIAFILSYILLEYERIKFYDTRRCFPRIRLRQTVHGEVAGQAVEVFVRDLSERGAMMQFKQAIAVRKDDPVALRFGFGKMQGKVASVQGNLVRVQFDMAYSSNDRAHDFIYKNMGLAI